jgi:hypothetical protein
MESMRATWTDERLDDLTHHVDGGFERVDKELGEVRGELSTLRREMRDEFTSVRGEMNQQFGSLREDMHAEGLAIRTEINGRLDSLQRTMIQFGASMIVAFVGLIVAVVLRGG